MSKINEFQKELTRLINKYSLENDSNTPDYILAEYLSNCLNAYNKATRFRDYFGQGQNKIEAMEKIRKWKNLK